MDFDEIVTYKKAFGAAKIIVVGTLVACTAMVLGIAYMYKIELAKHYDKILVIDSYSGAVTFGEQGTIKDAIYRTVEYKHHVKTFINLLYSYDQFNFISNVSKGLNLIGNRGFDIREDFKAHQTLKKLQEKNLVVSARVDSVKVTMDRGGTTAKGYVYFMQKSKNEVGSRSRYFIYEFDIYDISSRTEQNPHGCLIGNWNVVKNEEITEE